MDTESSAFKSFELNHSLFDLRIDDVPVWERLRFPVYKQIKRQHGTGKAHTDVDKGYREYLRGVELLFKNLFIKNPYFAKKSDVFYFGHSRRKKGEDGYWRDIYCDPIHDACDHEYIHFEESYLLNHLSPAQTSNLRYLDLIKYSSYIQRVLGINDTQITTENRTVLTNVENDLQDEFDVEIDLLSMTQEVLHSRRTILPLYQRLLKRVNPKLVVLNVSYGRETFIEACKQQNIPVVELQHGVIYPNHLGYAYPGPRTKETFPDYLLTFGEFWTNVVEFPIPDDHIIPVGYPYLEQSVDKYDHVETRDQLLFISQGAIGEQLSKFAVAVNQHPDIDHEIVYKLHPGEYDRWQTEYPWLVDVDFKVIDQSEPELYRLFAESQGQIGVYSTAVYEGLRFGLETYLYECPGEEILQPLLDDGTAKLITSADQLASALATHTGQIDSQQYFAPNATNQMCKTISSLITSQAD
jgi:hypothetical protein